MDVRKSYAPYFGQHVDALRGTSLGRTLATRPKNQQTRLLYDAANDCIDEVEGPDNDGDSFYETVQELVACLAEDLGIELGEDEIGNFEVV